jgi:glycosyltransferase involved in cell wall biosynthesis
MNQGLDRARGTYLAILESDDLFENNTLEMLLGAMEAHEVQLVKGNCFLYWAGPPKRNVHHDLVPHKQVNQVINPQVQHEIFHLAPSLWSALYVREFLADNDIRFLETPGASYQDASFNFKVWACANKVYFLKDEVIHYRQDNAASSINSANKAYCVCDEFAEMDRYLDEKGLRTAWLNAVLAKMRNRTYLWNYERLDESLQFEFLQRYAEEMRLELEKGHLDWSLLEDWDRLELESILKSPEAYHAARLKSGRGKFGKIKRVFRIGGPLMLIRFAWSKLFR